MKTYIASKLADVLAMSLREAVKMAEALAESLRRDDPTAEAVALLMREVVCEQVFRNRANWNPEHPNRALAIRDIDPGELVQHVSPRLFSMTTDQLKAEAARVLDLLHPDIPI